MIKYKIKCNFITPAFTQGASDDYLELNPPSIKGAIMFWWRALYGSKKPKTLKKETFDRFGGAFKENPKADAKMKRGGLTVRCPNAVWEKRYNSKLDEEALKYMAYGEYSTKTRSTNGFLFPKTKFTLILQTEEEAYAEEYLSAFLTLSYFGGLGAKNRNGFGQFEIEELTKNGEKINIDYSRCIKEIKARIAQEEKGFHERFNLEAIYWKTKTPKTNPKQIFIELARFYKEIKSPDSFREKRAFATPYLNIKNKKIKGFLERFPKSYFLSINKIGTGENKGKYQGQILFLPIEFHKESLDKIESKKRDSETLQEEYKAATDKFNKALDRKLNRTTL